MVSVDNWCSYETAELRAFPHLMNAREALAQGRVSDALSGVVDALRLVIAAFIFKQVEAELCLKVGGENAVFQALNQARENHGRSVPDVNRMPSILSEEDRSDILADAYTDGSSRLCTACHGLIAARRWAAHAQWCQPVETPREPTQK
jgi:hypothetical protein